MDLYEFTRKILANQRGIRHLGGVPLRPGDVQLMPTIAPCVASDNVNAALIGGAAYTVASVNWKLRSPI
jgi:hypothetical protein